MADITARRARGYSRSRYGEPRWVITERFTRPSNAFKPCERIYITPDWDCALNVIRALVDGTAIDADWLDALNERLVR